MNKTSISLVFAGFFSVASAQDDGAARSIMFGDQQSVRDHRTTMPDGQKKDRGERCMEMLRAANRLKGKPQRRSAAMERYRQECELR
jgi:hypothetical protein